MNSVGLEGAVAWYNKGNVLRDLGQLREAITCFDRTLKMDPGLAQPGITRVLSWLSSADFGRQ
ncbi:tetratricopeptide repeat protein [Candidatus Caldatribacterium saccharofermentans]|uniref:tetratricopeptide repeat protein n=1 Tax=Candidatus Caldatribacterium saccharofermentans TaxID=1454753 RepID=UPI003CFEC4A6